LERNGEGGAQLMLKTSRMREIVGAIIVALLSSAAMTKPPAEMDILDPPTNDQAPYLHERFSKAKQVAVIKITSANEVGGTVGICGYTYHAKVLKAFASAQGRETMEFVSFQPRHFIVGGYYLIVIDDMTTLERRIAGAEVVSIEGGGESLRVADCKAKLRTDYADDTNAFRILPAFTDRYKDKWVLLNLLDNRIDSGVKIDDSALSPCAEEASGRRGCVEWSHMARYVCDSVKGRYGVGSCVVREQ
jgi:hypothetical protein